MVEREAVVPTDSPSVRFAYSPGIRWVNTLYVSGQVPVDPATGARPVEFADQVRLCLANVQRVAQAAGGRLEDAVKVGVYLADLANFEEMDALYRAVFTDPLPARTTVQVGLNGVAIEIDAIIALIGQ